MGIPNLVDLYFRWISSMVFPDENIRNKYSHVLHLLFNTKFEYTLLLDENRQLDGIDMRYHFSCACKIPYDIVTAEFGESTCSVLEMMVGLAKRCDDAILFDASYGERTHEWFWLMFTNLGLDKFDDISWGIDSYPSVTNILNRFMYREYNSDGSGGGIFIISDPSYDMRNIELWDQMCLCANEIINSK